MKINDLVQMSAGNLTRRKSRTALTVLGIVIGTISVVLMVAVGLGMQQSVEEQFDDMVTANIITVEKGDNVNSSTRLSEEEVEDKLSDFDIEFLESIEGVETVSPTVQTTIKMTSGIYEASINVLGLEIDKMTSLGYEIADGRMLTEDDDGVFIFGVSALESFEEVESTSTENSSAGSGNNMRGPGQGNDMMRQMMKQMDEGKEEEEEDEDEDEVYDVDIYTDRISYTLDTSFSPQGGDTLTDADVYRLDAVGILDDGDSTISAYAYTDIDYLTTLVEDYDEVNGDDTEEGYDSAYVKVTNIDDISDIEEYIEAYGYSTRTMGTVVETLTSTTETLQIVLGAIGAVSLIVAAIGITNTMNMAIQERRKEIGVMKVIGATITDIKNIFLLESAMIGLLGGIVGITISVIASKVLSSANFNNIAMSSGKPGSSSSTLTFAIPTWLIFSGMGFTTMVGIVSGYFPARKAMRSSALEAIKAE